MLVLQVDGEDLFCVVGLVLFLSSYSATLIYGFYGRNLILGCDHTALRAFSPEPALRAAVIHGCKSPGLAA